MFIDSLTMTCIVFFRYVLVAGFLYLLCYKWKSVAWRQKRLSPHPPERRIMLLEFRGSLVTSVIFGVTGAWMYHAWQSGHTLLYNDWGKYGSGYATFSFVLLMILQDAYFYFSHRLLHIPVFFRTIHYVHHVSIYPTPWSAFCFHPLEAVIQALFLPVVIQLFPIHPGILILFLSIMTVLSVVNHLGYELYPSCLLKNHILKTFIGATNHSQHHKWNNCNYGLYFTWWDQLLRTLRENPDVVVSSPPSLQPDTF